MCSTRFSQGQILQFIFLRIRVKNFENKNYAYAQVPLRNEKYSKGDFVSNRPYKYTCNIIINKFLSFVKKGQNRSPASDGDYAEKGEKTNEDRPHLLIPFFKNTPNSVVLNFSSKN